MKIKPSHGHNQAITNGISRIGFMRGGKAALWVDEDMADIFLDKATNFVKEHQKESFFLYYALHQPHVPRVPHPRFAGKSPLGPRGARNHFHWSTFSFSESRTAFSFAGKRKSGFTRKGYAPSVRRRSRDRKSVV